MKAPPKVLFVARVASHLKNFHQPYMKWFQEQGFQVHALAWGDEELTYCHRHFNVAMDRLPLMLRNFRALKKIQHFIDREGYRLVHCHTPTGGLLARLAAAGSRKKGTKVLYTAHGFHFFKGANLKNWLFYYPPERALAHVTDGLILINQEDYAFAKQKQFPARHIHFAHGTGVDLKRFQIPSPERKSQLREKLGLPEQSFVVIYAAELSRRKNQIRMLQAVAEQQGQMPELLVLFVGEGVERCRLEQAIKAQNLEEQVRLLGHRTDVDDIMAASDLAVSTSLQEGLPQNVLESLASGLPVVVSDIRGHRDMVTQEVQGQMFCLNKRGDLEEKLLTAYHRREEESAPHRQQLRRYSIRCWSLERVLPEYVQIYRSHLSDL